MRYPFLDLEALNRPMMDEITAAMERVVRSGRYVGGPEVEQFENYLGQFLNYGNRVPLHVIGVSNGLDALRLTLRGWIEIGRLREGDEVIVAANTYIASVLAIIDAGLKPVLAEPSPVSLNLDTESLERYITPRTRVIMPVHLYGRTCWDERLALFVRRHNLLVIEDNAQAIGAVSNDPGLNGNQHTGTLGHAGAFSFYPTKNLGALGDAGAVATYDGELAGAVRALANYGSDRRYHNIYAGYNCRLDPVQAAVLSVKLPRLPIENAIRRQNAAIYDRLIVNPLIVKPELITDSSHVYHQYTLMVDERDRFRDYLADRGVMTDIHYPIAPHQQPCMARDYGHLRLPVTEQIARTIVSIPISSATPPADIEAIAKIINEFH